MPNPIAIAGTNVPSGVIVTPGGAQGVQGVVGPTGATGPAGTPGISADAGNLARAGSDSLIFVSSNRYNALSNPNFEVDARTAGAGGTGGFVQDRWNCGAVGFTITGKQTAGPVYVPGTNFCISNNFLRITNTAAHTPAAGDYIQFYQTLDGPRIRALFNGPTSGSLLCRSSVANTAFSLNIQDTGSPAPVWNLTHLCTLPTANAWTLIQVPNIPVFSSSAHFSSGLGVVGGYFMFGLAAGTTYTAPSNDTWVSSSGSYVCGPGCGNFGANAGATFDIAFLQWEPGPYCNQLVDKDFATNLLDCERYFTKTWDMGTAVGTATDAGSLGNSIPLGSNWQPANVRFPVTMVKVPTVTIYGRNVAPMINTIGYVMGTGSSKAVTGVAGTSTQGYSYFSIASPLPTVTDWGIWHHTADVGW
jgi:hypothetical protein